MVQSELKNTNNSASCLFTRDINIKSIYASRKVRMYAFSQCHNFNRTFYQYEYQFAICQRCFGVLTIFDKASIKKVEEYLVENNNNINLQQTCTTCNNKSISLTPLAKDENIEYHGRQK